MAEIITMPRLSDTMEEGTVASWLKKVGDKINEGDILAEIETDKATMEFESFHEGVLLYIGVQEGETTQVDKLLAIIGEEGEDVSALIGEVEIVSKEILEVDTVVKTGDISSKPIVPKGLSVITMPRLSDTMEKGTVTSWLKKVGDKVKEGDILAEIETDKATMEFESFNSGTLLFVGLKEGESAKVDSLLAIIGPKEADVSKIVNNYKVESSDSKAIEVLRAETSNIQAKEKFEPTSITSTNGRLFVSPLARKMADEKKINLTHVQGSGENGRIVKRDIENFMSSTARVTQSSNSITKVVHLGQEDTDEVIHSQMRKIIAKRLKESKFTAPHYYLTVEFDMENAIAFREQFNSIPDIKISYNDMVVKACALTLQQHPQVNSQWFDDKMVLNNHVHIGVAVAVDDGLVVPVVRFANKQGLPEIGALVKDFAIRARNKKLTPQEMEGSTFTISNLGMFGIESFTSIINQPNSAILSVGAIVQKPVVKNGQIVVGNTMKLTLACDHRTVDGVTGSEFLQTLKGYMENPITMLV